VKIKYRSFLSLSSLKNGSAYGSGSGFSWIDVDFELELGTAYTICFAQLFFYVTHS